MNQTAKQAAPEGQPLEDALSRVMDFAKRKAFGEVTVVFKEGRVVQVLEKTSTIYTPPAAR